MREKINEVKSGQNLIGKLVKIKSRDSDYDGEWGVIKYFDGDDYHIAPWNDSRMAMIFSRNEFVVKGDDFIPGYKKDSH